MLPVSPFRFVLLLLFASVATVGSMRAQWNYVGPAGLSNGWSMYNDIVIDSTGAPVITYYESPMIPSPVLRWDGTQWQQVGASSFSFPASAGDNQLLVGPDGSINFFFLDNAVYRPSVVRFDGTTWGYVGGMHLYHEMVNQFSMDYDTAGKLVGAFVGSGGFRLLRENGNAWDTIVTTGLPVPLAYPFIRHSPNGELHMAYTDMNTLKVGCMKLVGTQWQQVGAGGISSGFAQYNKLLFGPSGQLCMAYDDGFTMVMQFDGTAWDTVGVAGLGALTNGLEDLISDANGDLYLSTSRIAGDHARCYKWDGSSWGQVGPAGGINDTTAGFPNIAMGQDGTLYATYNDFEIEKAVVKSYAGAMGLVDLTPGGGLQLAPNPGNAEFRIIGDFPEGGRFEVLDAFGRKILSGQAVSGRAIAMDAIPAGIYWVRMSKPTGGQQWTERWVKQ